MKLMFRYALGTLYRGVASRNCQRETSRLAGCLENHGALLPMNKLLRLGTSYGGWLIPKQHGMGPGSIAYLAGAGEDLSFDCALARLRTTARVIDPTPRAITHFNLLAEAVLAGRRFGINNSITDFYDISTEELAQITFVPYGLADADGDLRFYLPSNPDHVSCSLVNLHNTQDSFEAKCYRLSTLMKKLGDSHVDLLKMDIEGAEYSVIRDIVASNLLPRLLLIEFDELHSPQNDGATGRIKHHIQLLIDAGMVPVAIEDCNITLVRMV